MKPTLTYLPLEPYKARYTELLSCPGGWVEKAFAPRFEVERIEPQEQVAALQINSGRVLDTHNRPLWAMGQISQVLRSPSIARLIYLDDFFHPGVESLPYSNPNHSLFAFCWAQSFDAFDFTREMVHWMRPYEVMMLNLCTKVYVASPLLADLIVTAVPNADTKVEVVGLPFDSKNVASITDTEFAPEPVDVVFASRFDKEKHPSFFLDLVESMPDVSFAICTGHPELKGNDYAAVARAKSMAEKQGNLRIYADLTKGQYYNVLRGATVQFNCSLQDWVSFTLLEALTFKCLPCYPNFRDFPYVFMEAPECMYSPGNLAEARDRVGHLLNDPPNPKLDAALRRILDLHDGTLTRIADSILASLDT